MNGDGAASGTARPVCHCCGEPVPEGNLAWDYEVPDPLMLLSDDQWARRVFVQTPQIVQVRELGNFIRVILPVPVEHDREATFGVWLNIPELREWAHVLKAAKRGGNSWAGVTFAGRLVTAVEPWREIFGSWTQARVPGANKVPLLIHGADPLLARVLTNVWPEETIRSVRGSHAPGDMTGAPTPNPYAGSRRMGGHFRRPFQ